jgi:hypothetical protein
VPRTRALAAGVRDSCARAAQELVAGAGARALELELELERAGAGAPVQELAAELAAAPRELLAKAPFVLKLDKGESPLPYPMADACWAGLGRPCAGRGWPRPRQLAIHEIDPPSPRRPFPPLPASLCARRPV